MHTYIPANMTSYDVLDDNISSSHLQNGNNYYCVVTYGGVRLSVTASWDPVRMVITCTQRNVSSYILCSAVMITMS